MDLSPRKTAILLALAATVALVLTSSAFAKENHPTRRVVLNGVITAVGQADGSEVLTLDRGDRDNDPADDVTLLLTMDTRISPPGATIAVDVRARVVALPPTINIGAYRVLVLVVKGRPEPEKRPLQACGSINALPDGGIYGEWTVVVPDIAQYKFVVNAQTQITPPGVEPTVGMRACFLARNSAAGWVAQNVELKPVRNGGDRPKVELNGIITALPLDLVGNWTLTLEVEGGTHYDVIVTPNTSIEGTLLVGAHVSIRATRSMDAAGTSVLTAERIKVVGAANTPREGHGHAVVRVGGVVSAISDDGSQWTLTHEEVSIVVTIGADTRIVGLASGESALNLEVEGKATTQADGSLVAKLLRVRRH